MTSQYPKLNIAYHRLVSGYNVPALVDYLRPAGKQGKKFDQIAQALEKVLAGGGENAQYIQSAEGIDHVGVAYTGDDIHRAYVSLVSHDGSDALIIPIDYGWVRDFYWGDYLSECYAAGIATDYELIDGFDLSYYEDPSYFIGFAEADLVLWSIISMYLEEAGVCTDQIEPQGVVFIALRGGDDDDFF